MHHETVTNMSQHTIDKLQELVQVNIDSANGFDEAADELKNPQLTGLCRELASERRQQAEELAQYVEINGEVAEREGSMLAALHRTWMKAREMFSSNDEYAVLAEAEKGEDHIKEAYEDTLRDTAGSAVNDVLTRQYAAVKSAHDRIRDLRDMRK